MRRASMALPVLATLLCAVACRDTMAPIPGRMAPNPAGSQLYIDFVKQNSYLAIDEEGTEAAAVTTVGIGAVSVSTVPVMRVDHPYIIVIREHLTGTVLFMGKVVKMP